MAPGPVPNESPSMAVSNGPGVSHGKDTGGQGLRLLVVGAGGIGCELLKNLVLLAPNWTLAAIHIVDLDTIDVSNLNRQFLFQGHHVHQPKAVTAREALLTHYATPDCPLVAHHGNITDRQRFPPSWFSQFDLVFSALDNVAARRHVNSMACLVRHGETAEPLAVIESGTQGYEGQVAVVQRGRFECFDCISRPAERESFPVCTIRSTPSSLVHCVVWAKDLLFSSLFGPSDDVALLGADSQKESVLDGQKDSALEAQEDVVFFEQFRKDLVDPSMLLSNLFVRLLDKCFRRDIVRLQAMVELWRSRTPPIELPLSSDVVARLLHRSRPQPMASTQSAPCGLLDPDEGLPEPERLVKTLFDAFCQLVATHRHFKAEPMVFDKDDEACLNFVYAAASLRALLFSIPREDVFRVKAIAGNIIPAIATTNAIIAALMVMEALKVLGGRWSDIRSPFYTPFRQISNARPVSPNVSCLVCNVVVKHWFVQDFSVTSLSSLVDLVFRHQEGSLVMSDDGRTLYDPDFTANSSKTLDQLSISQGSIISVFFDDDEIPVWSILVHASHQPDRLIDVFDGSACLQKTLPMPVALEDHHHHHHSVELDPTPKRSKIALPDSATSNVLGLVNDFDSDDLCVL